MKKIFRVMLVAALAGVCTQASAQSRQGDRYEMVNVQQYQNSAFGAFNPVYGGANSVYGGVNQGFGAVARGHRRYIPGTFQRDVNYPVNNVIILDKRSGELWSWSDNIGSVMYLGQIFPLVGAGPFARIIQVPEEKTR